MKVIDAYWEKRNLGVDVVEVSCDIDDEPESVYAELEKITVPYSVVKVPSGHTELLLAAQNAGYSFVETSFAIEGDIRRTTMPKIYERFLPYISIEEASDEMIEKVLSEVRSGEIFATDRIALDPVFSKEIAGQRYYNWARDILQDGATMMIAYYKGQPAAFNIIGKVNDKNTKLNSLIGGVLIECANMGIGFLIAQCEQELLEKLKRTVCLGKVSSNNLPILRIHMMYGYEIKGGEYVLTKHQLMD